MAKVAVVPDETGLPQIVADTDPAKALEDYTLEEASEDNQPKKLRFEGDEAKDELVNELRMLVNKGKKAQGEFIRKCELIDDAYKGELPDRSNLGYAAANVNTQLVKTNVRVLGESAMSALDSSSGPLFPLEPREASDVERVKKVEMFLDAEGRNEMKVPLLGQYLVKDAAKYGSAIVKVPFCEDHRHVTKLEVYDGENEEDKAKFAERFPDALEEYPEYVRRLTDGETLRLDVIHEDEVYRGPKPQRVDRKKFIPAPDYTCIEDMPYAFEELSMSWMDLQRGVDNDMYEAAALEKIKLKYEDSDDPNEYLKKQYQVYEGWYFYDHAKDGVRERCMFTFINDEKVLLRAIKYPYKHNRSYFILCEFIPDADALDGESIAYDSVHSQKLMNMLFNTAIDCDAANLPTFVHNRSSTGRNLRRERWRPFKVWELSEGEQFQQFSSGHSASNSLELMQYGQRFTEDSTRLSQLWTGGESKIDPRAPAAKTQMLIEMSQRGVSGYVQNFRRGWCEMVYQICEIYSQYGTKGKEFRVLNEQGEPSLEAAPDDLRIRPDMQPQSADMMYSRSARRDLVLEMLDRFTASPVIQQNVPPENIIELWKIAVELWPGGLGKRAKQLLPNPQEVMERESIMRNLQEEMKKRMELELMLQQIQGGVQPGMQPQGGVG